jgi:hypothetical protein
MRGSKKSARIEREAYFQNLRCQNARVNLSGRGNEEGFERLIVTAVLLLGELLAAPGALALFGFGIFGESGMFDGTVGFRAIDWLMFLGAFLIAAAFVWIAFGEKLAALNSRRRDAVRKTRRRRQ